MPLEREHEKRLVRRLQELERERNEVFDELYAAYERHVRVYLAVRVRDEDSLEEIVQLTWLRFWKRLATYDPDRAPLVVFLRLLAQNELSEYFKRRNLIRHQEQAVEDLQELEATVYGASTTPPVEQEHTDPQQFARLLGLIFETEGPPHQLVVFCFQHLLEWTAKSFNDDVSRATLDELTDRLQREYLAVVPLLDPKLFQKRVQPLRDRLKKTLAQQKLVGKTEEHYAKLLNRITGRTQLRDYYGERPAKDIDTWSYSVRRRVIKKLKDAGIAR